MRRSIVRLKKMCIFAFIIKRQQQQSSYETQPYKSTIMTNTRLHKLSFFSSHLATNNLSSRPFLYQCFHPVRQIWYLTWIFIQEIYKILNIIIIKSFCLSTLELFDYVHIIRSNLCFQGLLLFFFEKSSKNIWIYGF